MGFEFKNTDQTLTVFSYDSTTKEFLRETELEIKANTGLPANTTTKIPPEVGEKQVTIFDGSSWALVSDFRGPAWDTATAKASPIEELGEVPDGLTLLEPAEGDVWATDKWVVDPTVRAENYKIAAKAKLEELKYSNIIVNGKEFKFDKDARAEIEEAINFVSLVGLPPETTVEWRLSGKDKDTFLTVNSTDMTNVLIQGSLRWRAWQENYNTWLRTDMAVPFDPEV